jgi:hypothetical protein
MRIFRSLGFGVFLLILWISMPKVFHSLEDVLLSLLSSVKLVLQHTQSIIASPAHLSIPTVAY